MHSRNFASAMLVSVVLATGCRMGLPPEPPGTDATDASSAIPVYQPSPDPFTRSAFAGETLKSDGGHDGHHGHHGHKMPSATTAADSGEVQR